MTITEDCVSLAVYLSGSVRRYILCGEVGSKVFRVSEGEQGMPGQWGHTQLLVRGRYQGLGSSSGI